MDKGTVPGTAGQAESPFVIVKDAGSWHLKSRGRPGACIGCARADVAGIIWAMAFQEGWAAALAAASEAAGKARIT